MNAGWQEEVEELLGKGKAVADRTVVEKLSKDYYWYSPLLHRKLKDKVAEGVVKIRTESDLVRTLAYAYEHRIPVTPRGGGTGNYGQAVPLNGGLVLDLTPFNDILEIGNGYARCQAGVRLGALEKEARKTGQELRIYPSTLMIATIGGFIGGGSAGIGSITYGGLWSGNVLELAAYTMEEEPRRLVIRGEEMRDYIHGYGTTGILAEVVIPLAPAKEWEEAIGQFERLEDAVRFANRVADDAGLAKRVVSLHEWPLPGYFIPLARHLRQGMAAVLLEAEKGSMEKLRQYAEEEGGEIGYTKSDSHMRKGVSLTDFTFNHTTLWALKADASYTYLQAGFSSTNYERQIAQVKAKFGDEVLMHMEWMKAPGGTAPANLPLFKFTTEERLNEIIRFLNGIGVPVNNPHTWKLDANKDTYEGMVMRKKLNDPRNLLNPGKLLAGHDEEEVSHHG
ncbi:FAD-binding oxidoreductase [Paenibacillus arenilitoris]|uniref:FAD-binding oxidoreductase n=1 Tax=Paenibacillus arenilitoris TaxID=2772299 RepID=A0A927CK68_9BACL|nr:FAD-binding oxidoreductase [Paenibacillus arenilitoris]MBD2868662.1 FAD-binding oxidoreductase [Paenibacillus arenilitoris]